VNRGYRLHHPQWYRRRMPIFWWLRRWPYTRFITRELTSVAVGYSAVLLVATIWAAWRGEGAYQRLSTLALSGPALLLHLVVLAALLYHTVTWLNLAPRAIVVYLAGRRVPDRLILAAHYLAWLVVSGGIVWILAESAR